MRRFVCCYDIVRTICTFFPFSLKKLQDIKEKENVMGDPARWSAMSPQVEAVCWGEVKGRAGRGESGRGAMNLRRNERSSVGKGSTET